MLVAMGTKYGWRPKTIRKIRFDSIGWIVLNRKLDNMFRFKRYGTILNVSKLDVLKIDEPLATGSKIHDET